MKAVTLGDIMAAIARLLEVTEAAIKHGDWKVDGARDPDAAIEYAKHVLVSGGDAKIVECQEGETNLANMNEQIAAAIARAIEIARAADQEG